MDKQFKESSINPEWFVGIVEDRQDPLNLGRVRVRILGRHTNNKNELPTSSLPWAQSLLPVNNSNPYAPKESDQVFGMFIDGKNAQQPVILGVFPSIPLNAAIPNSGFNDGRTQEQLNAAPVKPNESATNYPRNLDEPTSSRLYRNESNDKSINALKAARKIDQEPASGYAAVPPYNNVYESESGHAIEIDDTPGAERLHFYHRSGSYTEYQADGTRVERIQKDKFTVVIGNDNVYVEGDVNVKVNGNFNITGTVVSLNDKTGKSGIEIKDGNIKISSPARVILQAAVVEVPTGSSFGVTDAASGTITTSTGQVVTIEKGIITNIF
jgi:hypothetical protein